MVNNNVLQDAGECLLHLMETLTETLETEER
jgi:hypothetical protein